MIIFYMSKGKSDKITYKPYDQKQSYLIPPSVDELIPENHLVRLVNEIIDEMDLQQLLEQSLRDKLAGAKRKGSNKKGSLGGGASRYNLVMMTKLFVYGYMTKVCSSRMLAKAAR